MSSSMKHINNLNNLLHYKNIFTHNRKTDKTIIFLKKPEFDIFYSCKYKYPLLVKEKITLLTGKTQANTPLIDRRNIVDPFREDPEIPEKYRHTLNDYNEFMAIGMSMGHNAPAGQHKTNISIFGDTFLLSNITPQEMVFNSGLWVLMENWCKHLSTNKNLHNITVFTGSIPSKKSTIYNGISMNIPHKMFKIVVLQHINHKNTIFMDILIGNNKAFYVNPNTQTFDFTPFLVDVKSWNWFEKFTGININTLLNFYNFNTQDDEILPIRDIIPVTISLSPSLRLLMKKSNWFGYIIYSPTITKLDSIWEECKLLKSEFDNNLSFFKEYYDKVRQRLLADELQTKYKNAVRKTQIKTRNIKQIRKRKQTRKYKYKY